MKIITKYSPGEQVYVLYENKIVTCDIAKVMTKTVQSYQNGPISTHITYNLNELFPNGKHNRKLGKPDEPNGAEFPEQKIFRSKKTLIQNL